MNCLYHQRICFTNWLVFVNIFLGLSLSPCQLHEPLPSSIRNCDCPKWIPAQIHWKSSCSVNTYSAANCLKGSVYEDCPSFLLRFTPFSNLVFFPVFLTCRHTFLFMGSIYGEKKLSESTCISK